MNLGTPEIVVIFLVALIVLGPDKLPGAARQAGKVFQQFKSMSSSFQTEMRSAMKEAEGTLKPLSSESKDSSTGSGADSSETSTDKTASENESSESAVTAESGDAATDAPAAAELPSDEA